MAKDGLMPQALCCTKAAPGTASAVQSVLAITVVWVAGLRELLSYLGITLALSSAVTVATLFVVVRKDTTGSYPFNTYPWAPLIYVSLTLLFICIAATKNPWEALAAILTIVSGIFVFLACSAKSVG